MYRFREKSSLRVLSNFWINKPDKHFSYGKIPLTNITSAESLLAAILRSDSDATRALLECDLPDSVFFQLLELIKSTKFATMILNLISECDLLSILPPSFRAELSKLASRESATRARANQRFAKLIALISNFGDSVLVLKGAALSRSVYARAEYRNYSDLDILVKVEAAVGVISTLESFGFRRLNIPSDCNQVGAGPTSKISDLMLTPHPLFVPAALTSLMKNDWPVIDVKVSPLDRGIQVHEIEKFFEDRLSVDLEGHVFFAPSLVDHLIVSLHTLAKDGFSNWRTLFDIHMLASRINDRPAGWEDVVLRCRRESLTTVAWAGLTIAQSHFKTSVPMPILDSLAPVFGPSRIFAFTLPSKFIWNSTSLPMMLLNACTTTDSARRLKALLCSIVPPQKFLSEYYNDAHNLELRSHQNILLHWLVLLSPGGLVRKTIGRKKWLNAGTPKFVQSTKNPSSAK